jgi:hypothetical protein
MDSHKIVTAPRSGWTLRPDYRRECPLYNVLVLVAVYDVSTARLSGHLLNRFEIDYLHHFPRPREFQTYQELIRPKNRLWTQTFHLKFKSVKDLISKAVGEEFSWSNDSYKHDAESDYNRNTFAVFITSCRQAI